MEAPESAYNLKEDSDNNYNYGEIFCENASLIPKGMPFDSLLTTPRKGRVGVVGRGSSRPTTARREVSGQVHDNEPWYKTPQALGGL